MAHSPEAFMTWLVRLLPFVEQPVVWEEAQSDFQRAPNFEEFNKHRGGSRTISLFHCPSEPFVKDVVWPENVEMGFTHYLGVSGTNGWTEDGCLFGESRVRFAEITDGLGNTLLVGERPPSTDKRFGWWYAGAGQAGNGSADSHLGVRELVATFRAPMCRGMKQVFKSGVRRNMCDTFHFWSNHPGGAHFLFADGSVRFVVYTADAILPALATRSRGEIVPALITD
jgi:prepilin-type processing-associated H-X9-DG protein